MIYWCAVALVSVAWASNSGSVHTSSNREYEYSSDEPEESTTQTPFQY